MKSHERYKDLRLGDVVKTKSGYGIILDSFVSEDITRYQVFTRSSTVFTFFEDEVVPVDHFSEMEDIYEKLKSFTEDLKATA